MDYLANFHILGSSGSKNTAYDLSPVVSVNSSDNPRANYSLTSQDPNASSSVKISGHSMVLSRLFKLDDPAREPPVASGWRASGLVYDFLTQQDRNALGKIYEYADKQGYDLRMVDELAFTWACYRSSPACGTTLSNFKNDGTFDLFDGETGQLVLPEFNEEDESIAVGILTSKAYALNNSIIPANVLDSLTDPSSGSANSKDYMKFLEKVVYAFSSSGNEKMENATTPIRPKDVAAAFVARLQEKGWDGKTSPADFLRPAPAQSAKTDAPGSLYDQWQSRIKGGITMLFDDNDKDLIGRAYQLVSDKGGTEDDFKRMDEAVARLGAQRLQQSLAGQLVDSLTNKDKNKDNNPAPAFDLAHLEILGEMKRMAG